MTLFSAVAIFSAAIAVPVKSSFLYQPPKTYHSREGADIPLTALGLVILADVLVNETTYDLSADNSQPHIPGRSILIQSE